MDRSGRLANTAIHKDTVIISVGGHGCDIIIQEYKEIHDYNLPVDITKVGNFK